MRRGLGAAGGLGQVVAWLVILVVGGLVAVTVLVPRVAGATPYTILTGSMRPAMPPGTLVVVRPVPMKEIGIGAVITYQLHSGEPDVVTHRVIAVGHTVGGKLRLTTKGDANPIADALPVRPVQVRGERWYYLPYAGYVNEVVNGRERHVVLIIVVSGLLLYAGSMFLGSARDRLRGRPEKAVNR